MLETLAENGQMLWENTLDTLFMTFGSAVLAYVIGLPLGIWLSVTDKNGLRPNRTVQACLGWVVNIGRSFPFIILMLVLIPVSRAVVGTMIGPKAAIVSLTVAAAPFSARLVESSLAEIDRGVVEAAKSMGATNWQIIYKVLLPESIPSLVRGASITVITLIGYSAMAGAVGAGGLGDVAIRYGYHRYQPDMMVITVVLLVIIVQIIQSAFNLCAKLIDKRNR